jgi:hypothetical protein
MNEFESICLEIRELLIVWEPLLLSLNENVITVRRNRQKRSIKQILGHMTDSASNNTHRVVHFNTKVASVSKLCFTWKQRPLDFIQDYQQNWKILFFCKSNLHWTHIVGNGSTNLIMCGKVTKKFVSLREHY